MRDWGYEWELYEAIKRRLMKLNLTPEEMEKILVEIAERLGI